MTDRTVSKTVCMLLESDQELMADVHKHFKILENELVHTVLRGWMTCPLRCSLYVVPFSSASHISIIQNHLSLL